MDSMEYQRETSSTVYRPDGVRQPMPQSHNQTAQSPASWNRLNLGHVDKEPQASITQQEVGSEPPERRPYQPDWITAETQDITDRTYYDADANDKSAYTHHQSEAVHFASDDKDFERPRQVPGISPRSTRVIVREDIEFLMAMRDGTDLPPSMPGQWNLPVLREIAAPEKDDEEKNGRSSLESVHVCQDSFVRQHDVDFYLALLNGSDPPPVSPETEALVLEEQEMRRRSLAATAEEADRRRAQELKTTQIDLDFLAALLE